MCPDCSRYTGIGQAVRKGWTSVKTEMTRTRGSLLSEPSDTKQRVQRAGRQTVNTHARKGTPGRHPGRFQVANLEPSKRCSRMPLIGLVRLRWALEGAIPSFDPIQLASRRQEVGRHGNGIWQAMA